MSWDEMAMVVDGSGNIDAAAAPAGKAGDEEAADRQEQSRKR
jgi:hypothetical protein